MYCNDIADREDLFQDIVLQLWRAYPSFKGESAVTTWIYRIALNTAISRLRKAGRTQPVSEFGPEAFNVAVTANDELTEQVQAMYQAIRQLSPVDKALTMLYLDSRSYREMAEVLGLSVSNIGYKINLVKQKLRIILEKEGYGPGSI